MAKESETLAQLLDLWQIVRHRKWAMLLAGVLLAATSVILVCLIPDWYSSSITVLVDPQKIPDRYVTDTVTMDQLRLDTLTQQVLSLTRLEHIVEEMQLYPDLRACMPPEDVIDYMRKNITIQIRPGGDRNPSAFTITYKAKDSKVVAQVATRLAESFIEWDLAAREHQAVSAAGFVSSELQEAKATLAQQEMKLREYKMQHLDALPEQVPGKLARLQTALQANIDTLNRYDSERVFLTQAPAAPKTGAAFDRAQLEDQRQRLEAQLADLRSRYSEEYPDVTQAEDRLAQVQVKIANLPQTPSEQGSATHSSARLVVVMREIARLQEEQKSLSEQVRLYQAKADELPIREQQLADLNRDYFDSKLHYQNLMDKSFSAGIATDLQRDRESARFTVLEPARIPDKPIKPHRGRLLALMVPFCFFFSIGTMVSLERVKGRIATERELRAVLPPSVAIIGRIPVIPTRLRSRRQAQWASVAISSSILCCLLVALFVWHLHPHL